MHKKSHMNHRIKFKTSEKLSQKKAFISERFFISAKVIFYKPLIEIPNTTGLNCGPLFFTKILPNE